jgi:hypothetical protein
MQQSETCLRLACERYSRRHIWPSSQLETSARSRLSSIERALRSRPYVDVLFRCAAAAAGLAASIHAPAASSRRSY